MAGTTSRKYSLSELNALPAEAFVQVVGPVFEHSPWIAEAAAPLRPFTNVEVMHRALTRVVEVSDRDKKLSLIQAHPDLAGRLAQLGKLTAESSREQASAGLDQIDELTRERLEILNHAYQIRFAFPFIICARLNDVASILSSMEFRLDQTWEQEIATALVEIDKIADLRLRDLIQE